MVLVMDGEMRHMRRLALTTLMVLPAALFA
jgi:hypothetical protein